jgi:hypothetical protein
MSDELRWSQRAAVKASLGEDLAEMNHAVDQKRLAASVGSCLHELAGGGDMVGWAAVAVRREADGSTTTYVCGDPDSTNLEIKGYLHSAVWQAAHQEEGLAL